MTPASTLETGAIRFERIYDVPVEDLWDLWTTKEGLAEWFAPEGMHVEVLALDLRVGGTFDHVMTAVGAEQIAYMTNVGRPPSARVSGRFVEIMHHQRLRIRFDIDFVPGVEPYPYDIAVAFHAEGERMRMVVTADRHPDPEMTRGATLGLTSQLNRFEVAIAARAKKEQHR
jgi:uncharacterized protein YndB with AHSA1/START domain